MNIDLKYRFPRYKALPKGWSFNHDGYYSHRWENWKANEVEGSYVTNYAYKACMFKDKDDAEKYEEDARRHYIVCEDGCADWSMPILYKQVEIDPETLRQQTPYTYVEILKGKPHICHLWENDMLTYHFKDNRDSVDHYGIVVWKEHDFVVMDLMSMEMFMLGESSVIEVDSILGTKFEFIHHEDIFKNSKKKDPFLEESEKSILFKHLSLRGL